MGRARLNGQSGGAKINGIIEEYIVQAGSNISAGDFVEFTEEYSKGTDNVFNSGNTADISAVALTDTDVLIAYGDTANFGYGTAQILTIMGDTLSANGSEFVFLSKLTKVITSLKISATSVLLTFRDDATTYGNARVLSVSGNTITAGTLFVINSASTYPSSVLLSSTRAVVAWGGIAQILGISGTTVSNIGAQFNFENPVNAYTSGPKFARISSTCALLSYSSGSSDYYPKVVTLTIIGDVVTKGTPLSLSTISGTTSALVPISSDKVLVLISASSVGNYGYAYVVTINGSTALSTLGLSLGVKNPNYDNVYQLSPSKYLVLYRDYYNSSYCTAQVIDLVKGTISTSLKYVFYSASSQFCSTPLSNRRVLTALQQSGNGVFSVLNLIPTALLSTEITTIKGVAKSKGSSGEKIKVYTLAGGI